MEKSAKKDKIKKQFFIIKRHLKRMTFGNITAKICQYILD